MVLKNSLPKIWFIQPKTKCSLPIFENISSIYLIKETSLVFFHAIVIYFPQAEQYWVELITLFIK